MEKINIDLIDLQKTIKEFYNPKEWRFITVNALETADGYEVQWIFSAIGRPAPEKIYFTNISFETIVPTITAVIPSAKYSEAEMQDLLGVVFEGANYGIFLEPDAPRAPLLRKNRDQTA